MFMLVLVIVIHIGVYWRECRLSFCQSGKEAWWKNHTCALLLVWSHCIRFVYKPLVQGDLRSSLWSVSGRDAAARARCLHCLGWVFSALCVQWIFACRCWRLTLDLQTGEIVRLCAMRSYALLRSSVWSLFAEESSQYGEIFWVWTLVSPLSIRAGQPLYGAVCAMDSWCSSNSHKCEVCSTGTLCCSLWVHEAAHTSDGWQT